MKLTLGAIFTLLFVLITPFATVKSAENSKPNIIYILADDMGYGDVHILNPERGKIPTPNLDHLAQAGMVFTDAHTAASVCTPSRYGILTGRYCWRTKLQHGVLDGYSRPLIPDDRMTVASFLKTQGYQTGCVGKWHLGMDMSFEGKGNGKGRKSNVDFAKPITHGPNAVGFDYYYGIAAALDMPPYVYIENDHFTAVPTKQTKGGAKPASYRPGLIADGFEMEQVLPHLTDKAVAFIHDSAGQKMPFFLYFPLPAPHTPIAPSKEFKGKTSLGAYGDYCFEVDAMVGKVLAAIEEVGATKNTLVVFTADNGCSPSADFEALEALGHYPSAQFRGMKADVFEGGHRVPFLMRWPEKVKAGTHCDKIICLTDLLATCADLFHQKLPENVGEDSISMLSEMLGLPASGSQRDEVIHNSNKGFFAIRKGNWKLELCPGSGGWSNPMPGSKEEKGLPPIQLYDLSNDIGERHNRQAEHPEVVQRLTELLKKYVEQGRSTPGTKEMNDAKVNIHGGKSKGADQSEE